MANMAIFIRFLNRIVVKGTERADVSQRISLLCQKVNNYVTPTVHSFLQNRRQENY